MQGVTPAVVHGVPRARDGAPDDATWVLGVPFRLLSLEQATARIESLLDGSGPTRQVVLANAHTLNLASESEEYRRTITDAALVLRDGLGVEIAVRLAGADPGHNFVGTDFVPAVLRVLAARATGARVFLVGGREGVAAAAAKVLEQRIPGLRIAGTASGYREIDGAIAQIRIARPDVVLVGLGNPLQEEWIQRHRELLDARVAIGVGALFDYLAGRVPRAPRWMRRLRGEWLFRLFVEPRRLWRRYLIGNVRFLVRVTRSSVRAS